MNWFEKLMPSKIRTSGANDKKNVPEGLWAKCDNCDAIIYRAELERNQEVCTKCDFHMRIGARKRLEAFFDEEGRVEIGAELEAEDVLKFKDDKRYRDRLQQAQKQTGEKDALLAMRGSGEGRRNGGRRLRVPVHGRFHGLGGRRKIRTRGQYQPRTRPAADLLYRQWRRTHAGSTVFTAANGQDQRSADAPVEARFALYLCTDRSHHGWRVGEFCHARRYPHCRTGRPDRLCRSTRHRANRARNPCRKPSSAANSCSNTAPST